MRPAHRITTVLLALAMLVVMPLSAVADEDGPGDDTIAHQDREVDHPVRDRPVTDDTDHPTDHPTDRPTDHPTDRPTDHPTDRPTDHPSDRPTDHPQVDDVPDRDGVIRDRCQLADNPRRCLHDPHDRPDDVDVRHLIWRLIQAHEWHKLIRVLYWLGVI